jgi:hypothetical protein
MFDFCRSRLTGAVDGNDAQFIGNSVDALWRHVIMDTTPSAGDLLAMTTRCSEINLNQGDELQGILLAQLLGGLLAAIDVFSSHSCRQSMLLAEYVINCLDADVSMRTGISPKGDLSAVPSVGAEIRVQEQMICYLEDSPSLSTEDALRFRQPHI